jgi:PAS domain S-box-containing protein
VFNDITEKEKARQALSERENYLRTIFNTEPECIKILGHKGEFIYMNPAGLAMIEADNLEMIKSKSAVSIVSPEYRDQFTQLTKKVFEGESGSMEFEITGLKGTHRWLETHAVPLKDTSGNIISLLSITRDITERKKAEEEMRLAIERFNLLSRATHDTIWDWDIQHDTMIYNEGMMRMFGYTASDIAQAADWWKNNIHPEDRERIAGMLNDVFEHKTETIQMEYRYRGADGTYKHILDRALVLYDTTGNPLRMIGAMQDISWQKDEELRMGKLVIDAQERERHQIGMELHDNVNQILGTSLMYLSMASNEAKSKNEIFDTINQTSGFIKDAIAEIRRLSHQLAPASFKNVSLKEVFESLVLSMNSQKNWAVQIRFDASYHDEIREDVKINLYRILQEQLNNIHKYARADKVEISVRVIENSIQLHVEDNGVGFNPKTVKRGIGLENISRRTEVFNGRMQLRSAPGQGCKLLVEIPLEAN